MPGSSLLYAKPPESGEEPELPLEALTEGFEVTFTENGVLWVFPRVGQRHEDDPSFDGLEDSPVDASEAAQEVHSACPGEAPYPVSVASTETPMRTEPVTRLGILEGE